MRIPIYQIDAFTDKIFGGNPAAVCPLDHWMDDEVLLNIAKENNLAETAFFLRKADDLFHLRWFTPEIEMDLCGHATLASAYVIFRELGYQQDVIRFDTHSGILEVRKTGDYLELNFPSRPPSEASLPEIISQSLNIQPLEIWQARDYLLVYESQSDILNIKPDVAILNQINLDPGGIIVTAPASEPSIDFVSRFFTPQATLLEDPVTGSAHCTLIPYWANRLDKSSLQARQLSERQGHLICELHNDRVMIRGKAVKFLQGFIEI